MAERITHVDDLRGMNDDEVMAEVERLAAERDEARQQRDGFAVLAGERRRLLMNAVELLPAGILFDLIEDALTERADDDRARQIGAAIRSVLGFAIGHRFTGDAIADSTCFECQARWLAGEREVHESGCQVGLLREARGAGGGS